MTYNVFGGTLSLIQSIMFHFMLRAQQAGCSLRSYIKFKCYIMQPTQTEKPIFTVC